LRSRPAFLGTAAILSLWLGAAGAPAATSESTLQVLHWWTSASERKAADVLVRRLAAEGLTWEDAAIPGGAGQGAGKVLRSRLLAGTVPEITQLIGVSIAEWAEAGLLVEFDAVAAAGNWAGVLFPTINTLVRHRGHVVAAPLGIHRINTLFVNLRVFARLGLVPPATWAEFERLAPRLQAQGVVPLAQSSEPWQVATLFENLVLAEGGVALHRELFVRLNPAAAADRRVGAALERLRALKAWMGASVPEQPWTEVVARLARGEAAMLVMGDWAKGELNAAGAVTGTDFACLPAPGTGRQHLYSVDTLSGFAADYAHAAAQDRLASTVMSPATQLEYNALKGSVPVRRDTDPAKLDACARASYAAFARDPAQLAPSLAHRMATDEASKDAIIAELQRFFADERVAPAEVQRRLAAIFRALPARTGAGPTDTR
jgi:glucose/mannose transport system substrate-binding protein